MSTLGSILAAATILMAILNLTGVTHLPLLVVLLPFLLVVAWVVVAIAVLLILEAIGLFILRGDK